MVAIPRPKIQELPRSIDRMTFVYLDQCSINVDGGSIVAWRENHRLAIPAASMTTLVLGPGSKITHDAIKLLAQSGTVIVWSGADQTRFYAAGQPLASKATLINQQAKIVSNDRLRVQCAKKMYSVRFPDADLSTSTMQQLRGWEGTRMKEFYKSEAKRTGVPWKYRQAQVECQEEDDSLNKSLTIGNQVLYAVEQGVCAALGVSPALGVIHTGFTNSFVFDLADCFKCETTIPVAFEVTRDGVGPGVLDSETRRRLRTKFVETKLLSKSVEAVKFFFSDDFKYDPRATVFDSEFDEIWVDEDGGLWTKDGVIPGSVNYSEV